ncbi:MAG: hypothetical protein OEW18_02215 [Candidatus Aminicenantes bacterium]|nr:hypothetical protein [Candidatus Aminicenantes bacterium]
MKRLLCFIGFLALAAQLPLWCYDSSPSTWQIVPEVIYAPATGGGAWVTELQITSLGTVPANIYVYFDYAGGSRGVFTLYTGLAQYRSVRFSNVLSELQALDPSFTYFGRVGSLYCYTEDVNSLIQIQARTVNGNYGKTFPGLTPLEGNTAAEGRPMMIQDLVQNATYRTSVGIYNSDSISITVTLTIVDADNLTVGAPFTKTLNAYGFLSFNPFTQAGVPTGTYANCWLYINVTSGGSASNGLMSFGSIANNFTNDTYALIARMYN